MWDVEWHPPPLQVPVVNEMEMLVRYHPLPIMAMRDASPSSEQGFAALAHMLITYPSCVQTELNEGIVHHILAKRTSGPGPAPSGLGSLPVPRRHAHFLDAYQSGSACHSAAGLLLGASRHRPRMAQIEASRLASTELGRSGARLLQDIARDMEYLRLILPEVYQQEKFDGMRRCLAALLPAATRSLSELRLYFESTLAMRISAQLVLPAVRDAIAEGRSRITTLGVSIQRVRPGESDLLHPSIEPLLRSLSAVLQRHSFSTLVLEGMSFRQPDVLPGILTDFLGLRVSERKRLVLSRLKVCALPDQLPKIEVSDCSGQFKELKFHSMVQPNPGLFAWILGDQSLCLHSLELPLESFHVAGSPEELYDTTDYLAKRRAFELCTQNRGLRVASLLFHIHLFSCTDMHDNFTTLFQNPSIHRLELACCNIGTGNLLPSLTQGLKAHVGVGLIHELDLSSNQLGLQHTTLLSLLFYALFSLPQVPLLSVDLSSNHFTSSHFALLQTVWERAGSGVKGTGPRLRHLGYSHNYYSSVPALRKMAASFTCDGTLYQN